VRNSLAAKSSIAETPEAEPRRRTKADPLRVEQLNVRVPRRVNVLLKRIDYLCADRGVDTNKQELVQFWLSQLPVDMTDDFIENLLSFQEAEGGSAAGSS
jgi:hypothetical protein